MPQITLSAGSMYMDYFMTPHFIFVRDMLTYLALLGLHLAICLEPSQLSFSGLEWAILIFLSGRLLMELNQVICDKGHAKQNEISTAEHTALLTQRKNPRYDLPTGGQTKLKKYVRDHWNFFDILFLSIFFCVILPLRIFTWTTSESVTNNRALVVAGYLYGVNTMFLTIRVFGQILETMRGIGTIQIALFRIIRDVVVILVHFIAITVAFSGVMTKVYVAESSMVEEDTPGKTTVCHETGINCWWKMTLHLLMSLLELSEGLDLLKSVDSTSDIIAGLLFAIYLVMAVILLINMLIALLSNTYQRVQDNAENEWAYQRAVTIQTYCDYHPIPVPFNIISIPVSIFCYRRREKSLDEEIDMHMLEWQKDIGIPLLQKYRYKYGDSFPPTDKHHQMRQDTENTERMVTQVLYGTFKNREDSEALLPTGQKAWETDRAIVIEDCLLTCHGYKYYRGDDVEMGIRCGARYCTAFSPHFPHFEVMILETGETKWLGLGVVFDDYGTTSMPGLHCGTVGYHTEERKIYDVKNRKNKKTAGYAVSRRGDVIRCTVMFENEQERDGKVRVPVAFTVNGSRIILEGNEETQAYIDYSPDKPLYPYVAFKYENSVLAKMRAREDVNNQSLQLQEVKCELAALKDVTRSLEEKLDALLAKFDDK